MAVTRKAASTAPKSGKSKGRIEAPHDQQIAILAYLKAEARGFSPGRELDDWLEAEKELNSSASKSKH